MRSEFVAVYVCNEIWKHRADAVDCTRIILKRVYCIWLATIYMSFTHIRDGTIHTPNTQHQTNTQSRTLLLITRTRCAVCVCVWHANRHDAMDFQCVCVCV